MEVHVKPTPSQEQFINSSATIAVLYGPQGEGKCHAPGAIISMFDGSRKKIEDIEQFDKVLGPDGAARTVMSLGGGIDEMFEVSPLLGAPFIVNRRHILSLRHKRDIVYSKVDYRKQTQVRYKQTALTNVSVNDYLKWSQYKQEKYALWRVAMNWKHPTTTKMNPTWVLQWLNATHCTIKRSWTRLSDTEKANAISEGLATPDGQPTKRIPLNYITSSRANRMAMSESMRHMKRRYTCGQWSHLKTVSKDLAEDITFLLASLGFPTMAPRYLLGNWEVQFIRVKRFLSPWTTDRIMKITPLGRGQYYGIAIDGDHLYCMGDLLVTHNTWAGTYGMLKHYSKSGGQLKGLLIRDTLANILSKTTVDMNRALEPVNIAVQVKNDKHLTIPGLPGLEMELVGMNDQGALNRIQGGGYSFVWAEEVAPVYEQGSGGASLGIPQAAFLTAMSRAAREGKPRIQVTMNPGSQDHWSYDLFIENPIQPRPGWPDITTETIFIPYGENQNLSDLSRQLTRSTFSKKGMEEYFQRYVAGKFSFMPLGKKVTPEYNGDLHRSKVDLNPIPGVLMYRLWDGGLNPSCVLCQVTPNGYFQVTDTLRGEGIGLKQLIGVTMLPLLSRRYKEIREWRDIGDPSMLAREQSNSEHTAARTIHDELGGNFEPGESVWSVRREALKDLFSRMVGGQPMFQVSNHEGILHRGLQGGWHYRTSSSGTIAAGQKAKPVKDLHSHICDALSHGVPIIFGHNKSKPRQPRRPSVRTLGAFGRRGRH